MTAIACKDLLTVAIRKTPDVLALVTTVDPEADIPSELAASVVSARTCLGTAHSEEPVRRPVCPYALRTVIRSIVSRAQMAGMP